MDDRQPPSLARSPARLVGTTPWSLPFRAARRATTTWLVLRRVEELARKRLTVAIGRAGECLAGGAFPRSTEVGGYGRVVQLCFDPDQMETFEAVRDEVLARFGRWSDTSERAVLDAQVLLDWKWGYEDGDLATWTLSDLDEFLLEWCPRKLSMYPDEGPAMVAALRRFFTFLAAERLLGAGSSSLRAIDAHLVQLRTPFVRAMGDRSRFGMAKSLFAGLADLGLEVDDDDPGSWQALIDTFNELPFDERGRILGLGGTPLDPRRQLTDGIELPPALSCDPGETLAWAKRVPVLVSLETIRAFVGTGRKLTAKGNLSVADAQALASLLGVDARTSRQDDGAVFAVRSADDLGELQFLLRWARAAGATRVAKGRVMATAAWTKLDAIAAVRKATGAILNAGPTQTRIGDHHWAPRAIHKLLDEGAVHLLALLWAAPEPVPFENLYEIALEVCDRRLQWAPMVPVESRQRQIRHALDTLFDVVALAGVTVRDNQETLADAYGHQRRHGGDVSLIPLGRVVLADYLRAHQYEIPTIGELTGQSLAAVFERIGVWHPERVRAEFGAWVAARGVEEAVQALTVLLEQSGDPLWRIAAVDLAGGLPTPPGEQAVRRLLDTSARGHALGWLHEHGCCDIPDDPAAMIRAGVELLACHTDPDTDDEFVSVITAIDDIAGFIDTIWRIPEPHVGDVLASIGRIHPDRATAKHARKALIRHRSHLANIR